MAWVYGSGLTTSDRTNGARWDATSPPTSTFPPGSPGNVASGFGGDAFRPAWFGGSALPGGAAPTADASGILGAIARMMEQVQAQIARLTTALAARGAPSAGNASARFENVSLASVGDPHLSVSGSRRNADGTTSAVSSTFDSMVGHDDLFSTRDFGDGFRVATTVTTPSAQGVTKNAGATATMDGGRESVTLTNAGMLTVTDRGAAVALTPGQTVRLSGGQTVTENAAGSVTIAESAFGRTLSTTFAASGGGVDVTARGENVTLRGDLLSGGTTPIVSAAAEPSRSRQTRE